MEEEDNYFEDDYVADYIANFGDSYNEDESDECDEDGSDEDEFNEDEFNEDEFNEDERDEDEFNEDMSDVAFSQSYSAFSTSYGEDSDWSSGYDESSS